MKLIKEKMMDIVEIPKPGCFINNAVSKVTIDCDKDSDIVTDDGFEDPIPTQTDENSHMFDGEGNYVGEDDDKFSDCSA